MAKFIVIWDQVFTCSAEIEADTPFEAARLVNNGLGIPQDQTPGDYVEDSQLHVFAENDKEFNTPLAGFTLDEILNDSEEE